MAVLSRQLNSPSGCVSQGKKKKRKREKQLSQAQTQQQQVQEAEGESTGPVRFIPCWHPSCPLPVCYVWASLEWLGSSRKSYPPQAPHTRGFTADQVELI